MLRTVFFATTLLVSISLIGANAHAARKSRFRSGSEVRDAKPATRSKSHSTYKPQKHTRAAMPTTVSRKDGNIVREDGKMVLYKKHNVVDFDDALIEGEVKNPSEFYFVHRPEEKFGSLIKKRRNFHKEMLRDTVMIR